MRRTTRNLLCIVPIGGLVPLVLLLLPGTARAQGEGPRVYSLAPAPACERERGAVEVRDRPGHRLHEADLEEVERGPLQAMSWPDKIRVAEQLRPSAEAFRAQREQRQAAPSTVASAVKPGGRARP